MKYTPDGEGRFAGQSGYGYRSIESFVEAGANDGATVVVDGRGSGAWTEIGRSRWGNDRRPRRAGGAAVAVAQVERVLLASPWLRMQPPRMCDGLPAVVEEVSA